MEEKKRARRRRDLARMKRRAVRLYGYEAAATLANHMTVCSGWCCGNPRKWCNETTLQERRQMESDDD